MKRTTPISVWVGTRKGAFVFRSSNRKSWDVDGPFFKGWDVNHVAQDPRDPKRVYAAVNSVSCSDAGTARQKPNRLGSPREMSVHLAASTLARYTPQ